MEIRNHSTVVEFILLGFTNDHNIQVLLFQLFLIIYIITISGNVLLIVAVRHDLRVHSSMYFFLTNLSFLDICYTSIVVPKMLVNLLSQKKSISLTGCLVQVYFFLFFGESECILLAFMAYDRFVAICNPLHYNMVMNEMVCIKMITLSCMTGFTISAIDMFFIYKLKYCYPVTINHYFCEAPLLLQLSCNNSTVNNIIKFVGSAILLLIPLFFILYSYFHIVAAILRINSGGYKAFYTCISHLIVVVLFYGSAIFVYMRAGPSVKATDKMVSVFYTIITPMLNPMIYSLRNKDVHRALRRLARL